MRALPALGLTLFALPLWLPLVQAKEPPAAPVPAEAKQAAPSKPATAPKTETETETAKPAPPKEADPNKPLPVPEGTAAEILNVLNNALKLETDPTKPEEAERLYRKTLVMILAGAEKILANDQATAEQRKEALEFKISILYQGGQADVPGYAAQLAAVAKELFAKQPKDDLTVLANVFALRLRFEDQGGLSPAALPAIEQFLQDFPGNDAALELYVLVSQTAEETNNLPDARAAMEAALKHFGKHPVAPMLKGRLRRLDLPGNPVEIAGPTLEGPPLDLASWKGKVIVVDFWATWCGPCLAEMPTLRQLYEKYRAKGFEIVGIPLDDDRAPVDEFMKENKLPWPQIYTKRDENGHPVAIRYAVETIPTVFLIGRDGKVISTRLRGPELAAAVANLFGEKPSPEQDAKPAEAKPAAAPLPK